MSDSYDLAVVADLFYGGENYGNAVRALALGEEPLRERLRIAYTQHAIFAVSTTSSSGPAMSEELQGLILAFNIVMTQRSSVDTKGSIDSSIA